MILFSSRQHASAEATDPPSVYSAYTLLPFYLPPLLVPCEMVNLDIIARTDSDSDFIFLMYATPVLDSFF
jgi:hypothetical protein